MNPTAASSAGISNHAPETAEFIYGGLHQPLHLIFHSHIAGNSHRRATAGVDFLRNTLSKLTTNISNNDTSALLSRA